MSIPTRFSITHMSIAEATAVTKYGLAGTLLLRDYANSTAEWEAVAAQRQPENDFARAADRHGAFASEIAPLVEVARKQGVHVAEAFSNGDGRAHILFDSDEGSRWFLDALDDLHGDDEEVFAYVARTQNEEGRTVIGLGVVFPTTYAQGLSEYLDYGK